MSLITCVVCRGEDDLKPYKLKPRADGSVEVVAVCTICREAIKHRVVGIARNAAGQLSITDARQP